MPDKRIKGLSGGSKQLWLRQHRPEVLSYLSSNGPEATMQQFAMKPDTFERFLNARVKDYGRLTKSDRALLISQSAIEIARDTRDKTRQLEDRIDRMEPAYQVMLALGVALKAVERLPGVANFLPSEENRA